MTFGAPLGEADALLFESAVVPRYLSFYASLAVQMMLPYAPAKVGHLGCRVGYPHIDIAERFPESKIVGVDCSDAALTIARQRVDGLANASFEYLLGEGVPAEMEPGTFTHTLGIHPMGGPEERARVLADLQRLLVPGGQAVFALPVRGSFPEINDMLREFALRQDLADLGKAVDLAASSRPTIETVSEELENAGLTDVDVDVSLIAISFESGREFVEDPIARLMVFPDLAAVLPVDPALLQTAFKYVEDAIQKYWSEGVFELTVNVGCASGRKI